MFLFRNPVKNFDAMKKTKYNLCLCRNPMGGQCVWEMCRKCCRVKTKEGSTPCPGQCIRLSRYLLKYINRGGARFLGREVGICKCEPISTPLIARGGPRMGLKYLKLT